MKIGSVKEIKSGETRVGLTPSIVAGLADLGHEVYVQKNAGIESKFNDKDYKEAGAIIKPKAKHVWHEVELMVKVKEPQSSEIKYFNPNLTLFTYLHLASPGNKKLVEAALKSKGIFIAYETIEKNGKFPLLKPMSEIAGKVAVDYGLLYLKHPKGIKKKLPEKVLVIGGGTVGESAARKALGLEINTAILEKNPARISELYTKLWRVTDHRHSFKVLEPSKDNLIEHLKDSDIVIGSVYIAGERAKRIVKDYMLDYVQDGTVFVDVAIDQGGCFEFSEVTSVKKPAFILKRNNKKAIVIGVPNMPATVGATATNELCQSTGPYILKYANNGFDAVIDDFSFKKGVNIYKGDVTCKPVAEAHNLKYKSLDRILTEWFNGYLHLNK